jgi:hypothetical protein
MFYRGAAIHHLFISDPTRVCDVTPFHVLCSASRSLLSGQSYVETSFPIDTNGGSRAISELRERPNLLKIIKRFKFKFKIVYYCTLKNNLHFTSVEITINFWCRREKKWREGYHGSVLGMYQGTTTLTWHDRDGPIAYSTTATACLHCSAIHE